MAPKANPSQPIVVTIKGFDELFSSLTSVAKNVTPAAGEALVVEAASILRQSRKEVPFDKGVLSSSGRIHEPFIVGNKAGVEISYGGATDMGEVKYAEIQHENETFRHAPGRKAFYLRDPVDDARENFNVRFARNVKKVLANKQLDAEMGDTNGDS
jgi:hypothetical protein